jgi:FkbM family methyltransferase
MNWLHSYLSDPLYIIDAGARGDLEWLKKIASIANVYAFDPDPEAIAQLSKKYKAHPFKKLELFQEAIDRNNAESILYKTSRPSMSSLLSPEPENYNMQYALYGQKSDWKNNLKITEEIKVNSIGIDEIVKRENIQNIDLLKLDTQGNELDILKSAEQTIKEGNIKIIITEVSMFPIYKNQALFSDLDIWLRENDFIMADYRVYPPEPWHRGKKVLKNERTVYATSGDAVYLLNPNKPKNYNQKSTEKTALVMAMLEYTSIAYYMLTEKAGLSHEDAINKLKFFDKRSIKKHLKSVIRNWLPLAFIKNLR